MRIIIVFVSFPNYFNGFYRRQKGVAWTGFLFPSFNLLTKKLLLLKENKKMF